MSQEVALLWASAMLVAAGALAQGLTPAEVEALRRAAVDHVDDKKTSDRIESAITPSSWEALDSLRANANHARDVLRVEPVPVTPPVVLPPRPAPEPDELPAFGYDIFRQSTEGYQPIESAPVGDDYVIGPGDELVLTLWGDAELVQSLSVDREGRAFVRDVGLVSFGGRRLVDARRELRSRLAEVYSGLRATDMGHATTSFDLTVGKLRTVQVFVLGEVERPGAYRIASNASLLDVLYRAGGARETGSLRSIRVNRAGTTIAQLDLYRVLLGGDVSDDVRLESGDVVHVPRVGARVALRGQVFRPALYEVLAGETLSEVLTSAGGLTSKAFVQSASVRRIVPPEKRTGERAYGWEILTASAHALDGTERFEMRDGDEVEIAEIDPATGGYVSMEGNGILRPGRVAWTEGMTLADAIDDVGLRPEANLGQIHVVRLKADRHEEILSIALPADRTDAGHAFTLEDRDAVSVRSIWDFSERDSVEISGPVREPGRFALREGQTLQDLLFMARGLREEAYALVAEVARVEAGVTDGGGSEILTVPIEHWEQAGSDAAGFLLHQHDVVFVRKRPGWELQQTVTIQGEVRFPGSYSLARSDERLSELVQRAGGLKPTAHAAAAVFTRAHDEVGRVAIDLDRALQASGGRQDLVLMGGDSLIVPKEAHTVKVTGEVGFPSSVLFREGKGVDYYLQQAGGLTDAAADDQILVQRASGEVEKAGGGLFHASARVDAGTMILVPRKANKGESHSLKGVADVVSILTGAATTFFLIHEVTR